MEEPDRAGESEAGEAASGDDRDFYEATRDSLDVHVVVWQALDPAFLLTHDERCLTCAGPLAVRPAG